MVCLHFTHRGVLWYAIGVMAITTDGKPVDKVLSIEVQFSLSERVASTVSFCFGLTGRGDDGRVCSIHYDVQIEPTLADVSLTLIETYDSQADVLIVFSLLHRRNQRIFMLNCLHPTLFSQTHFRCSQFS